MPVVFEGLLYRALNPIHASNPLSGKGAELHGGRFNSKGIPALYTSLSALTALREANQVGSLQPTTLVSYMARIECVFDCADVGALSREGITPADLASTTWREEMRSAGEAKTQAFARRLSAAGFNGLLIRSFAAGAGAADLNLVLWRWGSAPPSSLVLIDDEGRLRPQPNPGLRDER